MLTVIDVCTPVICLAIYTILIYTVANLIDSVMRFIQGKKIILVGLDFFSQ